MFYSKIEVGRLKLSQDDTTILKSIITSPAFNPSTNKNIEFAFYLFFNLKLN